jgi:hypothetical protein
MGLRFKKYSYRAQNCWGFQLVLAKYERGLWLDLGGIIVYIHWREKNG